jgi:hypothetical protein
LDAKQWVIMLALDWTIEKKGTLQRHAVKMVAFFSNSQTTVQPGALGDPHLGQ